MEDVEQCTGTAGAEKPHRSVLLAVTLTLALALGGCGGFSYPIANSTPTSPATSPSAPSAPSPTPTPPGPSPAPPPAPGPPPAPSSTDALKHSINHIIFMVQENRGFDHYFGKLNEYRASLGLPADVDGLPADASNPTADGTGTITSFHLQTMCVENPTPSWDESHYDWNRKDPTSATPTLDGFVLTAAGYARDTGLHDVDGRRVMGYYTAADLPYYYFMATQFATSDRWFSPVMTRTQPNRMFLMAGDSAGHVFPEDLTNQIDEKTIFEELDNAGVSWKIYSASQSASFFNTYTYANTHQDHIAVVDQYFADLKGGTLPSVVEIEPGYLEGTDEHPGIYADEPGANVQVGAAYVSRYINALMNSPYWKDTVFILTWDEGGGFYDHVAPQPATSPNGLLPVDLKPTDICSNGVGTNCGFNYTGYRLPLIVVSPFAKAHYVSHTVADYTAILKLIETRFGLPPLTARDASEMNMTEFFDFQNPPWMTPPTPPEQPTNGACYFDQLP